MKRLHGCITARLERRLAFSHLLAILITMLGIQIALAVLVAFVVGGTQPIEGDAGWTALSYASMIGKLMDENQSDLDAFIVATVLVPEMKAKVIRAAVAGWGWPSSKDWWKQWVSRSAQKAN